MSDVTIRRLQELDLFRGCARKDLAAIDRLTVTVDIRAARRLCAEGTRGAEFFVIAEGLANLYSTHGEAALLGPGAWYGDAALLGNCPRQATVTTVTDSMVIVFGRREFSTLCTEFPTVRARLEGVRPKVIVSHDPVLVGDAVLSR